MVSWKLSLRDACQRPGRTLLTLLSIVIGVSAVVAAALATSTARRSYQDTYRAVVGRAALEVTADDGAVFDQDLTNILERVSGVKTAAPTIQRLAILDASDRKTEKEVKLFVLGVDPSRDVVLQDYDIVEGTSLGGRFEVLLNAHLAKSLQVRVGDRVGLLTRRGYRGERVTGVVKPHRLAAAGHGAVAFMTLREAQHRFARTGFIDRILLVLDEGADNEMVAEQVRMRLPEGLGVHPVATHSRIADETTLAIEQGLHMSQAFALVVAVFVIMNSFRMNVSERSPQLAILRAIGATRGQIARRLYMEAIVLGITGAALGSIVGIFGARLLNRATAQLLQVSLPETVLTWPPFVLAALCGVGVSLLGMYFPARTAGRISPLAGMRGVLREFEGNRSPKTTIAGLLVLVVAALALAACALGWVPMIASVLAAVVALVGLVLLMPLALEPATRTLASIVRPVLNVESELAQRQLLRHHGRTVLTVGVTFIAISTGIGLAVAVLDNVRDVRNWRTKAFTSDFYVRAMSPDMETGLAASVPDSIDKDIRAIPGITEIDTLRFVATQVKDNKVIVVAQAFPSDDDVSFDTNHLTQHDLRQRLLRGEVVIGSVLAQRTGLRAGDQMALSTQQGPRNVRIAAVTNEYRAGGLVIHIQRDTARRLLHVDGVDQYNIKTEPSSRAAVYSALQRIGQQHGLLVHSLADIAKKIDGMMAGIVASLWALLVLGFVVAAIGVVNTLTMNVIEQTRELGLLRVIAMTRRQVQRMVIYQGLFIGVLSLAPGVVAGVAVAYVIHLATLPVIGHPVPFGLHPFLLGLGFLVGLLTILAAAWFPARRASAMSPAGCLQYE